MKEKMNKKYATADPFGVKTNPDDARRKTRILAAIQNYIDTKRGGENFVRALDIGCGEGWITAELPAGEITGYDISDVALLRVDPNIILTDSLHAGNIFGEYDLILAAGVMVEEYDYKTFIDYIEEHATGLVVVCQNAATEVEAVGWISGEQISYEEFPYGTGIQRLRCFNYASKDDPDLNDAVIPEPIEANDPVDDPESPITDSTTFRIENEVEERNF